MRLGFEWMQQTRTHIRHGYKALRSWVGIGRPLCGMRRHS